MGDKASENHHHGGAIGVHVCVVQVRVTPFPWSGMVDEFLGMDSLIQLCCTYVPLQSLFLSQ